MNFDVNLLDRHAETIVTNYIKELYKTKNIPDFSVFII